MARITVEDCLENVDNRFQLVLVATKRARQLANGRHSELEWGNDKPTVLALREIAAGMVGPAILDEVTAREHGPTSGISEDEVRAETTAAADNANSDDDTSEPRPQTRDTDADESES